MEHEIERSSYARLNEIPFSSETKMMTTVHKVDAGNVAYTKGAPKKFCRAQKASFVMARFKS